MFQSYVPNRRDCPGYEFPPEKQPRQLDGGNRGQENRGQSVNSDNYYPSGERRPEGQEGEYTVVMTTSVTRCHPLLHNLSCRSYFWVQSSHSWTNNTYVIGEWPCLIKLLKDIRKKTTDGDM